MSLRPPIVRQRPASQPKQVTPPTTAPAERPVRPNPERLGPLRTVDKMLHTDASRSPGHAGEPEPPPATTPVGNAVATAYQVIDRYVKEGQEFAAGQSAWYQRPAAPAAAGSKQGENDLLGAALWLFEQMRSMAQSGTPGALPAPTLPTTSPTPPSWPWPRWPSTPASGEPRPGGSRWVEEKFDDAPSGPSADVTR